jgi:hypothetical protein
MYEDTMSDRGTVPEESEGPLEIATADGLQVLDLEVETRKVMKNGGFGRDV